MESKKKPSLLEIYVSALSRTKWFIVLLWLGIVAVSLAISLPYAALALRLRRVCACTQKNQRLQDGKERNVARVRVPHQVGFPGMVRVFPALALEARLPH